MLTFCKFRALNMPPALLSSQWSEYRVQQSNPALSFNSHRPMLMLMWSYSHPLFALLTMIFYIIGMSPLLIPIVLIAWWTRLIYFPCLSLDPYPAHDFYLSYVSLFASPILHYRGFGSLLVTTLMSLFLVDVCYPSDVDTPRTVICLFCMLLCVFPFRFV